MNGRLTGRQRAVIDYLAATASPDPDPPTVRLPQVGVAGHIRQVWAPAEQQPARWQRLRRRLHDTFTADLPAGGGS